MIMPNRPLGLKHAYFGIVLGYFFNNLLPAKAGEILRAAYLKRKKIAPGSEVFGSVVFERFLDGIVLISMIFYSLNNFPPNDLVKQASYSAIVFYVGILMAILLLQYKRSLFESISGWFLSFLPDAWNKRLCSARTAFIEGLVVITKPLHFFKALLMSYVCWAFSLLTIWLCMQMFSFSTGPSEALLLLTVLAMGAMIPSSPGMIGIYQFCCVLALHSILGRPYDIAATFGVVSHSLNYFFVLFCGFVIMSVENLKFSEFERNSETAVTT